MKCLWCGERLKFEVGRGWVHSDGQLFKTFVGEDGETRDDHCAFSIPDNAPIVAERSYEWRRSRRSCDCLTGCPECGGLGVAHAY